MKPQELKVPNLHIEAGQGSEPLNQADRERPMDSEARPRMLVDPDLLPCLSRWKWKAKRNASGRRIYAVRNTIEDGRHITLRLHHVVIGVSRGAARDVRFKNGDSLGCRRQNLEHASRSDTVRSARIFRQHFTCKCCGELFAAFVKGGVTIAYCSAECRRLNAQRAAAAKRQARPMVVKHCAYCGTEYQRRRSTQRFCSDRCRYADKAWSRRLGPPPASSQAGNRAAGFL